MTLLQSRFLTSAQTIHQAPPPLHSEIAFVGRSNVGKSTLLNSLLAKKLAKSSSTPGKTQLINYFYSLWRYNDTQITLYFVDLPGFGYAKVSKETKKHWERNLLEFLQKRNNIKLFLQLIDARHPDLPIDSKALAFIKAHTNNDQQLLQIFTKCDKLSKNELKNLQTRYRGCLFAHSPMENAMRDSILQTFFDALALKGYDEPTH